jgi:serine/threonine-protein kinase
MGGMAEVFRATYSPEGGFQKIVALKRVLPQFAQDDAFIAMFRAEAALCSQFSHPGVVQVFDFGRHGDSYFLAMEYLDGPSLNRVLRAYQGTGLPIAAVLHLAVCLCESLQYVHERRDANGLPMRLVHRDLNPPNILLTRLGEVKLTDFGIARSTSQLQLTEAGMIKGKPGYLAPEQAAGEDFDGRVDLFALGVTLWECLVGQTLFSTTDATLALRNVFEQPIAPVRTKRPEVPEKLEAFVMQLLERDLSRRTPSARVALLALRELEAGVDGARALADVVNVTLKTTTPSGAVLQVEPRPSPEAVTLPARNA